MNDENEIIEKVKIEIEKIQPFMMSEGGILEFVKYYFTNGINNAYLRRKLWRN